MKILSGLVAKFNSAEGVSDWTVSSLIRWMTLLVVVSGLDPEKDLGDPERTGWSGLDIPAAAKLYAYMFPNCETRSGP